MRLLCWCDGTVTEASQFEAKCPYVMQRIHTLGYQPYHLSRHLAQITEATEELFRFATLCKVVDAERIIKKLLEISRVTPSLSIPVVMRIEASGRLSFEVESPSYNDGYYLRASRLTPAMLNMRLPDYWHQSSVTEAMDAMADSMALSRGGDTAIWIDEYGDVVSRPWHPIFAVYRDNVYTPEEYESVEYMVVKEAVARANLKLIIRAMPCESLTRMEELFVADAMGISAFSVIKNHKLLSVAATRIADQMKLVK